LDTSYCSEDLKRCGSAVAIKQISKEMFYKKCETFPWEKEKHEEECKELCHKAFQKECDMISRWEHWYIYKIFVINSCPFYTYSEDKSLSIV